MVSSASPKGRREYGDALGQCQDLPARRPGRWAAPPRSARTCRWAPGPTSARAPTPAPSASGFRKALALWRGHPFQDAEARSELDAEITRFNELRLVALETRVEADLDAGLDRELVGELEALTIEHPLRESFHSQYMLALYRAGRQAEALRAYTRMREYLADELGIEVGQTTPDGAITLPDLLLLLQLMM